MKKIKRILIGTHNSGKFKELSFLLPKKIQKISPLELKIKSPKETGKSFLANAKLKEDFVGNQKKERDFVDSINKKYGNGNLDINKFYDFAIFTLSSGLADKTFVFTQGVPATTWNIQHDLLKFPSVSVINNNNVVINGEVTYIDNNNVQLNFSAGFTGKAYLN